MSEIIKLSFRSRTRGTQSMSHAVAEYEAALGELSDRANQERVEIDWGTLRVETEDSYIEQFTFSGEGGPVYTDRIMIVTVEGCKHDEDV